MNKEIIIKNTIEFVKNTLKNNESGHDWFHIYRVYKLAKHISNYEKVDLFIVELGALLHDIADQKFHNGDETIGPKKAKEFLKTQNVEKEIIEHIINIIKNISFKGGNFKQKFKSPELEIIQDADRLDALGAIGIARTFNYGGYKNNIIYDPNIKPQLNMTPQEYKNKKSTTINHFYEKLLLLQDKMNTNKGKELAKHRHEFMEKFLEEFYLEWEGKL